MRREEKRYKDRGAYREVLGEELWVLCHTYPVQTVPHYTAGLKVGKEKGWDGSVTCCGSKISARD